MSVGNEKVRPEIRGYSECDIVHRVVLRLSGSSSVAFSFCICMGRISMNLKNLPLRPTKRPTNMNFYSRGFWGTVERCVMNERKALAALP